MNNLIFYFVVVFTGIRGDGFGASFLSPKEACGYSAKFAKEHGHDDPHWRVIKVTIDIDSQLYLIDPVDCAKVP